MKKNIFLTVVMLMTVSTLTVKAWNTMGHGAVAYIAEQHLTPEAKAKCRHYLKHTLPYYSSFADLVRKCDAYKHTGHWHGVPLNEDLTVDYSTTDNCPMQIDNICKQLKKYHKLKDSVVADNLKFLIHLVGDLHCPSHSKYPQYNNKANIYRDGKPMSFHKFWDQSLSYYHHGWSVENFARIDKLSEEEATRIVAGTSDDWARENAKDMVVAYSYLPENCDTADLTKKQHDQMAALTDRQIVRAGYRLAKLLNDIFAQ